MALAEPARRRILAELRRAPRSVNQLVAALDANQPAVSKHLKVLREAGFVSCQGMAQRRIYRLERNPFDKLDAWLGPYRRFWNRHLDALEQHLDRNKERERP
ncbi:MAG TPA: metalloregulator ArsR/SmtB family transcription factor [Polyangia bacterium]